MRNEADCWKFEANSDIDLDIKIPLVRFSFWWFSLRYKGGCENRELMRAKGWKGLAYWNVDGENTEDNFAWAYEEIAGHKQGVCNDAARTPAETDLSDVFISYRISVTDLLPLHGWLSLYHWIASGISLFPASYYCITCLCGEWLLTLIKGSLRM